MPILARAVATAPAQAALDNNKEDVYTSAPTNIRWRHVTPTLLIIWIVAQFDKSNISIVIADPKFLKDLHLEHEPALLGWLTTGLIIAYGIAAPAWGWLVNAVGARQAAITSLLLWAAICFASGVAVDYNMLLAARIALGLAEASLYPVTLALVASWFPLNERGRATAWWWIGTSVGPMLNGIFITTLVLFVGWRAQFYALGMLALILPLPMVLLLLRDRPEKHPAVNAAEAALIKSGVVEANEGAPGQILRKQKTWHGNYRYWLIVISIIFNSIFFWGWAVWLPTYLKLVRHFSFGKSGYLTFAIYGVATLTILAVGLVSDRVLRRAPLAAIGWLLSGVCLVAATFVPDRTACVILMMATLSCQQMGVSSAQALYHSVIGTKDMAKSQGVATAMIQIFGSFSPVMLGYFLKATPGDFTYGFMILAGSVLVSSVCMAKLSAEGL